MINAETAKAVRIGVASTLELLQRAINQMDRTRIEIFAQGGAKLRDAFAGLTKSQLLATPIPGTWSLQQIAIHLMESDMIASDRMKRIACMDKPLLIGYDESAFSKLPGIDEIDVFAAIQVFDLNRQFTATMLRLLPDAAFDRFGIHNEAGKVTLKEMLENYIRHLDGHLDWALKKRVMV